MTVKLLTEHHLEFLRLKGVYTFQNVIVGILTTWLIYLLFREKLFALYITPASNLGYLAPPGQFYMGAKLFIGTP